MYSWSDLQYSINHTFLRTGPKSNPIRVELVATVCRENHFKNFIEKIGWLAMKKQFSFFLKNLTFKSLTY